LAAVQRTLQDFYMTNRLLVHIFKAQAAILIVANCAQDVRRVVGQNGCHQVVRWFVWVLLVGLALMSQAHAACTVTVGAVAANPTTVSVDELVVVGVSLSYGGCQGTAITVRDNNPSPNLAYNAVCSTSNGDWNCANVTTVAGVTSTTFTPGNNGNKSSTVSLTYKANTVGSFAFTYTNNISASSNGVTVTVVAAVPPTPLADWRMDETTAYSGVAGEVKNSVGGGTNGTARRSANNLPTTAAFPGTIAGKLCGGVEFNGVNYLQVTGLSNQLSGTASLSFWINTTQIGSNSPWTAPGVTGVEQNGGANDIFWGWINATGRVAVSKGNTLGAQSTSSINNGVWRHIVLTRDQLTGETKAYVNGVLENTKTSDTGLVTTAFDSLGRIQTPFVTGVLSGSLDEVKVFAPVLSNTQVASIYANESAGKNWDGSARVCPVSGPHHLEILHASGTGLTCTASTLTVRACADASCTALYTGGVRGTLTATGTPTVNWDGTTGGAAGAGFVIPAGSSSVTKNVQVSTVGSVVFAVTVPTTPAANNATTCNFGSPACTFTASAAGFIFDVPHHVSEVPQTVMVSAVKTADNSLACVPAFASVSKTVTFKCSYASPASGTLPVRANGTALNASSNAASACDAAGKAVSVSFGPTGVASTSFQYADVGSIGLTATYTGSGLDSGLIMNGSDTFIAAPKDFAFSAITASPIQAGNSFSATVTARNNANAPTPNFINQTVAITSTNPQPAIGNATPINSALTGFSNGAATTSLVWNEVGTVDLNANLANYLGSGLSVSGVNAATGRFQPAYFDVSVTPGCGTFSYAGSVTPAKTGQPFVVTVKAKRFGGGATDATNTANYYGSNAFLTTLSNAGAATGLSSNTIATTGFVNGIGTANVTYAGVNEKVAPTTLVMRALDGDTPPVSSAGHAEGTAELRSGRLRLQNAYGSELLALPVPLEAQYWTGSYYATNTADNCTAFPASSIALGSYTGGLAACETQVTPTGSLAMVAGKPGTGLVLTKPGSGNGGSAMLTVNTGATASGNTCVSATASAASAANLPWLGTNLGARATFGIFKSPLIYRRENY
jgi:MSHA biogenesis protein MshQ